MSTRAMVDFVDSFSVAEFKKHNPGEPLPKDDDTFVVEGKTLVKVSARIYRHCDGYPDGLGLDLLRFFREVERQTKDYRFSDSEYLAAKFVVWQAMEYTFKTEWSPERKPLDFLSLGVGMRYHGDLEYVYRVDCNKPDKAGRPTVTYAEFGGYGGGEEKCGKFKPLPKKVLALLDKAEKKVAIAA